MPAPRGRQARLNELLGQKEKIRAKCIKNLLELWMLVNRVHRYPEVREGRRGHWNKRGSYSFLTLREIRRAVGCKALTTAENYSRALRVLDAVDDLRPEAACPDCHAINRLIYCQWCGTTLRAKITQIERIREYYESDFLNEGPT